MSMASSPTRDWIEFGARVASGSAWKRAFAALKPGDTVEIDGPYGHFVLDEERPAVFVAGGIGITPLKGMMEYATDKTLPLEIVLLYSNRTPEEIAFRDEIDALAARNPRLRVVHTITRPAPGWKGRVGRIDEALLREALAGLREPKLYVCGLPKMVDDMLGHFAALGVPASRVVAEGFHGYE
jgi:ferredoxin-NADP reductase